MGQRDEDGTRKPLPLSITCLMCVFLVTEDRGTVVAAPSVLLVRAFSVYSEAMQLQRRA